MKTTSDFKFTSLMVEVTNRCNKRCVHCFIPHEHKTNDITIDALFKAIDQCCDMGLKHITLTGGEPMFSDNFLNVLQKTIQCGLSITIYSSLTLLTDDITAMLKTGNIREVQASLYSINPKIHDSVTNLEGSCEKTKAALLHLAKNNIPVRIACPVIKQNKKSYKDVLLWAREHNIENIIPNIGIIARYDGSKDNLAYRLSLDEAQSVIEDILANDNAYSGEQYLKDYSKASLEERVERLEYLIDTCSAGLFIAANGNICPAPGWQSYILGNIEKSNISDIWKNSPKLKYLHDLNANNFPKCLKCSNINFCEMSLIGNANENPKRDPLVINEYYCAMADLTKRLVRSWQETNKKEVQNALPAEV
jgi:radical SAM protein with 4Fe4S-binding SPASM domain